MKFDRKFDNGEDAIVEEVVRDEVAAPERNRHEHPNRRTRSAKGNRRHRVTLSSDSALSLGDGQSTPRLGILGVRAHRRLIGVQRKGWLAAQEVKVARVAQGERTLRKALRCFERERERILGSFRSMQTVDLACQPFGGAIHHLMIPSRCSVSLPGTRAVSRANVCL